MWSFFLANYFANFQDIYLNSWENGAKLQENFEMVCDSLSKSPAFRENYNLQKCRYGSFDFV